MSETQRQARIAAFKAAGRDRILLLDGAKGAMIQNYKLVEDDYRGTRFANFTRDLKGNHDLLAITKLLTVFDSHDTEAQAVSSFSA